MQEQGPPNWEDLAPWFLPVLSRPMEECLRCYMIQYYSIFNNIFFMTEFNSWFRKKKKTPA